MTTTQIIYDFTEFYENAPKQYPIDKINGCQIFNPKLSLILTHQNARIPLPTQTITRIFSPPGEDGKTTIETNVSNEVKPIEHWIFIEAYCTGYEAGRQYMGETYPTPPTMAKDIKALRFKTGAYPLSTTIEDFQKFGEIAGQYSKYLEWCEQYPETFKKDEKLPETIPHLKSIFQSERMYNKVLYRLTNDGFCSLDRKTGAYHWQNSLNSLGGLAHKLKGAHQLHHTGTNQDLGRIFCDFFNIELTNEKAFQESTAKTQKHHYNWITDF
jgi:hypothetical protein